MDDGPPLRFNEFFFLQLRHGTKSVLNDDDDDNNNRHFLMGTAAYFSWQADLTKGHYSFFNGHARNRGSYTSGHFI